MGYRQLEQKARSSGARKIAVVYPHDHNVLKALDTAWNRKVASAFLIGDVDLIRKIATEHGIDLSSHVLESAQDDEAAAALAMRLVLEGSAALLMKGKITTAKLMRTLIKEGIRTEGQLLSHIAVFEHPRLGKDNMKLITDAGLITYPTLEQRVRIIKNAVQAMKSFGIKEPKTALLSLTEEVNEQIPSSLDASKLKEMNKPGGELDGFGLIDGPMDLQCALDLKIASEKGLSGEVAGRADILHCPDAVCGNMMTKGVIYFAQEAMLGGAVIGGVAPVVLLSRASSAEEKYRSILLGMVLAPQN